MKQNLFARLTIQEQDTFVNTATETSTNPTKNLRTSWGAYMQKYLERKKLHKFNNNNNNSNDDGRPTPVIHMTLVMHYHGSLPQNY